MTRNPLRAATKYESPAIFTSATSAVGPTPRKSLPAVSASASLLLLSLQKAAHAAPFQSLKSGRAISAAPHSGPSSGSTSCLKSSDQMSGATSSCDFSRELQEELVVSEAGSTLVRK